mmetsp:Transcript_1982/g.5500  ORF Transcript_1982/g.5500 Transcript_1982/m.5500 type:complete len:96 (+) Transcript_1982:280-567(+)
MDRTGQSAEEIDADEELLALMEEEKRLRNLDNLIRDQCQRLEWDAVALTQTIQKYEAELSVGDEVPNDIGPTTELEPATNLAPPGNDGWGPGIDE